MFLADVVLGNMETRGFLVEGSGLNVFLAVASRGNHEKRCFLGGAMFSIVFLLFFFLKTRKSKIPEHMCIGD